MQLQEKMGHAKQVARKSMWHSTQEERVAKEGTRRDRYHASFALYACGAHSTQGQSAFGTECKASPGRHWPPLQMIQQTGVIRWGSRTWSFGN
jgi:hypothetical protein